MTLNNSTFCESKRNRQVPRLFSPFCRMNSLACKTTPPWLQASTKIYLSITIPCCDATPGHCLCSPFPGRMRNSLASSDSYFCCQKVGITNYISECCHVTIVNPQWRRKQIVSVEATSCRAMDNIVRVLDYPWLREVRRKFVVSFCGGGDFFQKHTQVHSKIKLLFFSMLPCFVHNEYYLIILKRCCIEETAQP